MRWFSSLILALSASVFSIAAPPHFPSTPPQPNPPPTPSNIISNVASDTFYFITSDTEYVWKTVPVGVVKIVEKTSPLTVVGKFADGSGAVDEERSITDKFIYQVKVVGSGLVTLIGMPKGVAVVKDDDILVQTLTVGTPTPPAPVDTLTASIQSAYTAETVTSKATDKVALSAIFATLSDSTKWKNISTASDLFTVIHASTTSRLDTRLGGVRKLLGAELDKVLPKDGVLSAQNKTDAASLFARFSTVLDGVK